MAMLTLAPLKAVVSFPGGPGDTASAQKSLDQFFALWQSAGGDPMQGKYFAQRDEALAFIKSESPQVFVLAAGLYFAQKDLVPIAQIAVGGQVSERYALIVRKDGPTDLATLKGARVLSNLVADPHTARLVSFAGAPLEKLCTLVYERSPLAALKQLREGSIKAVLVDEPQLSGLADLPFGGELRALGKSDPLPRPIVAVNKGLDAAKLQKALLAAAQKPEGKELLTQFSADGLLPPDDKLLAESKKKTSAH
jgi:hypothetical protein